jgi:hypothetical protein
MSTNGGGSTAQQTGVRKRQAAVDQGTAAERTPAERTPDRITVALIPQASDDLQRLQDRTGLSKTDLTNRAISLYEFIDSQLKAGKDLIVKDRNTDEIQIVKLF